MNEWFRNPFGTIKEKWGRWTIVQKVVLVALIAAVVLAVIMLLTFSSKPTTVRLFNSPVTDENARERILTRLDQDNIKAFVSQDGYISVEDEKIARKYRSKLVAEGLEPSQRDPFSLFGTNKWTRNDFDDKSAWLNLQQQRVEDHLMQLDGIQRARVTLALPDTTLFAEDQSAVTASVILYAAPGSDVLSSRSSIQGIQNLVMRTVEGLTKDNITIVDGSTSRELNDFAGMEAQDRIDSVKREQKEIRRLETEMASTVLALLEPAFGKDRVRMPSVSIEMDMSKREVEKVEYSGITIKQDNPDTPYDDSEVRDSLVLSEETVSKNFTGTGFNPEGPAGVEGQNPPVYDDMSNVIGKTSEEGAKRNYALNEKRTKENESPSKQRRTVSVNIDGVWKKQHDEKGNLVIENGAIKRVYEPIAEQELAKIQQLVRDAVGYDKQRGDSVTVTNIAFDRSAQFEAEDAAFFRSQQTKRTLLLVLVGIAIVLVAFIIFRLISRELERRRRLREEELLRKQQAEREQALWDAKQDGMEVTMSVEERKRQELQEQAIALAKEHPEDVAMLIRTWLREEA